MNRSQVLQRLYQLEERIEHLTEDERLEMARLLLTVTNMNGQLLKENEDRLKAIESELEDNTLHTLLMCVFIKEQGLTQEYKDFVEQSIESAEVIVN